MAFITPKNALVKAYTPDDDYIKENTIRCYSDGNKNLLYINASHVSGTNNQTCAKIAEAVQHFSPDRVVIEANVGAPLTRGREAEYTNMLAHENNIPVMRGEPDDTVIFNQITHKGYSAKDVMALYVLRTIARDKEMELPFDEQSVADRVQLYLDEHPCFASIPSEERLTYGEFKTLYAPLLGKEISDVTTTDFAPFEHDEATPFQKLNAQVGRVREEHLNNVIADSLNDDAVTTTLVVYGGAHRTISDEVWNDALGPGADVSAAHTMQHKPRITQTSYRDIIAASAQPSGNTHYFP